MKKWTSFLKNNIFSKKISYGILFILILGIISSAIFIILINKTDQNLIIEQIKLFFSNINTNKLNSMISLKNSIIINSLFIILIWFFGLTVIGVVLNIIFIYLKGFLIGFTISSLILTYNTTGIIASFLFVVPAILLNIISITLIGIYSLKFSYNIILKLKNNKYIIKLTFLKYIYVLIISLCIAVLSSLCEVYVFPKLIKILIKLFI